MDIGHSHIVQRISMLLFRYWIMDIPTSRMKVTWLHQYRPTSHKHGLLFLLRLYVSQTHHLSSASKSIFFPLSRSSPLLDCYCEESALTWLPWIEASYRSCYPVMTPSYRDISWSNDGGIGVCLSLSVMKYYSYGIAYVIGFYLSK